MQEVENIQGMGQPYFNAATGLEAAGAQPNIGQYFDAESTGVMNEIANLNAQQTAQATGNLQQEAGGMGADRIAVAQSELANQQGLAAGQTLSQIMGQSVSQAQAGAGLEQSAGTNIAGIGTAAQNAALQGATAELQSGTLAQQQLQNQQNSQYENILQQISWPFQTNQYLGSMAAGVTPAMGGTGITSGNTKSMMANTSGLGKGMSALGGGSMGGGGSVPWEGGPQGAFDDIDTEGYDTGGAVDPLEIATGRAAPLPMPMQSGGFSSFSPMGDTSGGFSPATGNIIQIPYGPAFGGSQPMELGVSTPVGGQMANPSPSFSFATTPSGTEGLNIRGAAGAPQFQNPFLGASGGSGGNSPGALGGAGGNNQSSPFAGFLQGLYQERNTLMGATGAGGGGGTGGGGTGGWASGVPAMAGAWGAGMAAAHHKRGGRARLQTGGEPPISSIIFGQEGQTTPGSSGQSSTQQNTSGQEVGSLLGSKPNQNPAGGKTLIPQTVPQGHPSPAQQWATTNRQPNPMQLGQQAAAGAGNKNPFTSPQFSQPNPPTPSADTMNAPGQVMSAPGTGKDAPAPTPTLAPDTGAQTSGITSPMAMGNIDFGSIFAADGGAIDAPFVSPVPMDIGGDPLSVGLSADSPLTPAGEISGSVIPYNVQSGIYNQANQPSQPNNGPVNPMGYEPVPVPSTTPIPAAAPPMQGSADPFAPAATPQAPAASASPFSQPQAAPQPQQPMPSGGADMPIFAPAGAPSPGRTVPEAPAPTPPLSIPPTQGEGREQALIDQAAKVAGQPIRVPGISPPAPQPPAGGPPQQPAPQKPQISMPGQRVMAMQASQALNNAFGPMWKAGAPAGAADAIEGKTVGQLLADPQFKSVAAPLLQRPEMQNWLKQVGVTPQDIATTTQAPSSAPQPPQGAVQGTQARDTSWVPQGRPIGSVIVPMDAAKYAIGKFESGNNYGNIGVPTKLGRALGRYQVMTAELPAQLKEAGLPSMTPDEFLKNPQAQDQLFEKVFGNLMQKYGNFNDAASVWFSGRPAGERPNAKDALGTSDSQYVANTQALLKEWAGGAGEVGTRNTQVAEGQSPTGRNPPNYGPPPGMPPVNKASQFLMTLGTGDPTAYFKTRAAELGMYQQYANWDALRNAQYGAMPAAQAGSGLADEAHATKQLIGAVGGAEELAGEHGTITGAANQGHAAPSPGATVQPVGGPPTAGPPRGATAASPSAQPAVSPRDAMVNEGINRALMGISSGNPQGVALGNNILNGMIQRGAIDADTLNKRINAAKNSFGYLPGMGPVQYTPEGGLRSLVPGATSTPSVGGILPPPSPGSMPTQGSPAPSFGSPPGGGIAAPPPAPAGGQPTPLPTGAEPLPTPGVPAGGGPAARDFTTDAAFQPRAQAPRSSADMARDPYASRLAYDERAWQPEGQAQIKEEAAAALKDARGHIDSDRQADLMLGELEESLAHLPKSGALGPGPTMAVRNHVIGLYNDLARITAPALGRDALPQVNPDAVGSVEQVNKLANTLAFALARTLGSREAVQIVQQARNSVPSADVSPQGARFILQNLRAGIAADRDYYSGMQNWTSSNLLYGSSIKGYDEWFQNTHPVQMYSMRAAAMSARDPHDRPLSGDDFARLLANPQHAEKFDRYFNTPGLGRYYLQQHAGGP